MYHDVLPTISLQAAMQDLLNKIAGDNNFSTHDLVSPQSNPKRFKKFLSMLINFYVFSEGQCGKIEDIRNAVEKLVKAKKDFAAKNEELRNKITHFKSKAVEEAAEEEDLRAEVDKINMNLKEANAKWAKVTELKDIKNKDLRKRNKKRGGAGGQGEDRGGKSQQSGRD